MIGKVQEDEMFIVGDKMTIADFALTAVIFSVFLNEGNPHFDVFK